MISRLGNVQSYAYASFGAKLNKSKKPDESDKKQENTPIGYKVAAWWGVLATILTFLNFVDVSKELADKSKEFYEVEEARKLLVDTFKGQVLPIDEDKTMKLDEEKLIINNLSNGSEASIDYKTGHVTITTQDGTINDLPIEAIFLNKDNNPYANQVGVNQNDLLKKKKIAKAAKK